MRNIRLHKGNSGYWQCHLGPKGNRPIYSVHKLVLRAFVGEPPSNEYWVAHNDGNKDNNRIGNLRWSTPKENQADKHLHGTAYMGYMQRNYIPGGLNA
jgi:HNH endonuclease